MEDQTLPPNLVRARSIPKTVTHQQATPPHADLRSPTTAFSTHGTSPPPHHHRKTAARRKSSVASAGEGAARRPLSPITGGHCAGR
jgi:hypothetical protein